MKLHYYDLNLLLSLTVRRNLYRILRARRFHSMQRKRTVETNNGYSLLPFDQHQCLFVHIPKCAGISVCKALFGNMAAGHHPLRKYSLIFSPEEFHRYFKFTVVRNPWDRLLSAWTFLKAGGFDEHDRLWAEKNLGPYPDFESFVMNWVTPKNIRKKNHFQLQSYYVCHPDGCLGVDFVAYLENLPEDFKIIASRLGVDTTLSQSNRSRHADYRDAYTEEMKELVAEVYRKDIDLFGYTFDNSSLNEVLSRRAVPTPEKEDV